MTNRLQPLSYLNKMGQRCPQNNRLAHNIMAKFQASLTGDLWDELSAYSKKALAQFKLLHFSRSENGGTTDKKTRKKKI